MLHWASLRSRKGTLFLASVVPKLYRNFVLGRHLAIGHKDLALADLIVWLLYSGRIHGTLARQLHTDSRILGKHARCVWHRLTSSIVSSALLCYFFNAAGQLIIRLSLENSSSGCVMMKRPSGDTTKL